MHKSEVKSVTLLPVNNKDYTKKTFASFPDAVTCKVTTRSDHTSKGTSSLKPISCGRLRGIITGQMCNRGFIYGHGCPRVCVRIPTWWCLPLMTAFLIKPLNANEFRLSGRQLLWWPGRVTAPYPHIKPPPSHTRFCNENEHCLALLRYLNLATVMDPRLTIPALNGN